MLVRIGVLAVVYFGGATLGFRLAFENENVTAIWPPTGIAVAALLTWGNRVWPGIAIGALAANLANGAGIPTASAITVGNTLAPVIAVLVLRSLGTRGTLDRVRDVIALFTVGILAMTLSASAGTAALWLNDAIGETPIASVWLVWWIGDAFGVVLFAPFVLLVPRISRSDLLLKRPAEFAGLLLVSAATMYGVFIVDRPIAFVISIPVVWAALRFEMTGTAVVVVIVTVIAVTQTVAGLGQFATETPTDNLLSLQIFNAVVGFASMVLAAVMHKGTRADAALRASEQRYRLVFDQASDFVCIHDPSGRLTYVNGAAEHITGYSRERLLAMRLTDLVAPESVRAVRRTIDRQLSGELDAATYEVEIVGTSGRRVTLEVSSTAVRTADGPAGVQLIGRDVTTRRLAEEQLRRQSLQDPLTSLPNRTLLRERLEYAVAIARRDGTQVVLALIDLDSFKEINDARGHDAGDLVLQHLADRLSTAFRDPDTVARLGSDEFAVLLPSLAPGRSADVIVEQLRAELESPFDVDGTEETVTASIGVAVFPVHADDVDGLIRRADVAMHDAKRSGGAQHSVYRPDFDSQSMRRFTLEDELHSAIEERGFVLHYQPKIDVGTMRTTGVEALLRWPHPRLGSIPPAEFIPLAAAAGLMDEITEWVLGEAIGQCATWVGAGFDLAVAVNLSAADVHEGTVTRINAHLIGHDLGPERLIVEVSEADVRRESSHRVLERICAMGVRLSVDDFGTGASSMAHLSRLPIAELKIDRSFITNIATVAKDRAVARSIVELAHNLGLRAAAEGVETREAWHVLGELGCDEVQGYLVCRPIPANELESWLHTPAWSTRVR